MKKVLALSVSGLLMLGAASQASASFEAGGFTMSIYDLAANQEMSVDLGTIADLSAQNVTLFSGLDFTGWDTTAVNSGVGIYQATYNSETYAHTGFFAVTKATDYNGVTPTYTNADTLYQQGDMKVRGSSNTIDSDNDGIAVYAASYASSYWVNLNNSGSPGLYGNMNMNGGIEADLPVAGSYVDMYLYQYATNMETFDLYQVGDSYQAVIRLTSTGDVILNPNAVPVPGAVWLLGSGLAGLIGFRRRKNS